MIWHLQCTNSYKGVVGDEGIFAKLLFEYLPLEAIL